MAAQEIIGGGAIKLLEYNTIVPPYVRSGLLSRSLSNNDLLLTLKALVLITYFQLINYVSYSFNCRRRKWFECI